MGEQRAVSVLGKMVQGEEIAYNTEAENWNIYKLEDGTTIKMKLIVHQIVRTNEFNQQNEPIYVVSSQNLIVPNVPEKLKKKI